MTRYPPRFPRPAVRQRSFRTPPVPGTTAPASGSSIRTFCSSWYSSSERYSSISRVNSFVSMKQYTSPDYTAEPYMVKTVVRLPARDRPRRPDEVRRDRHAEARTGRAPHHPVLAPQRRRLARHGERGVALELHERPDV